MLHSWVTTFLAPSKPIDLVTLPTLPSNDLLRTEMFEPISTKEESCQVHPLSKSNHIYILVPYLHYQV